jgi:hypothetical protein
MLSINDDSFEKPRRNSISMPKFNNKRSIWRPRFRKDELNVMKYQ